MGVCCKIIYLKSFSKPYCLSFSWLSNGDCSNMNETLNWTTVVGSTRDHKSVMISRRECCRRNVESLKVVA